jgi:hypothetical protein
MHKLTELKEMNLPIRFLQLAQTGVLREQVYSLIQMD